MESRPVSVNKFSESSSSTGPTTSDLSGLPSAAHSFVDSQATSCGPSPARPKRGRIEVHNFSEWGECLSSLVTCWSSESDGEQQECDEQVPSEEAQRRPALIRHFQAKLEGQLLDYARCRLEQEQLEARLEELKAT